MLIMPLLQLILLLRWSLKGAYSDGLISKQDLQIGLACTDVLDYLVNYDEWTTASPSGGADPLRDLERLLRALREG